MKDVTFMRGLWASVFLAVILSSSGGLAQGVPGPTPNVEWQAYARFLGRIVGLALDAEDLPTLPVGYDPRFQMKVEVLSIHEGTLPVKPGGRLAFLIHSPSLFFMRYLGRKPKEFGGLIEGPFEFTIVRQPSGEGGFLFDLRIEAPAAAPAQILRVLRTLRRTS